MNKVQILREVITKLVPMLTSRGLRVTQVGAKAFVQTDAKTLKPVRVNIPHLPDDADESLIFAVQGFIDHEVGHVLDTDWAAVAKSLELGRSLAASRKMQPHVAAEMMRQYHNIVEDPFVERKMVERFKGSAYNVDKLYDIFIAKISKPAIDAATTPVERFNCIMVPLIRAWAGQQRFIDFITVNGYDKDPLVEKFTSLVPEKVRKDIGKAKTSWDTLAAAQAIFDVLHPEPPPPPPPPPPAPPQPQPPEPKDDDQDDNDPDQDDADDQNDDQDQDQDDSDSEKSDDPDGEGSNEDKPEDEDDKGSGGEPEDNEQDEDKGDEADADGEEADEESDGESEGDKDDDAPADQDDTGDSDDTEDDEGAGADQGEDEASSDGDKDSDDADGSDDGDDDQDADSDSDGSQSDDPPEDDADGEDDEKDAEAGSDDAGDGDQDEDSDSEGADGKDEVEGDSKGEQNDAEEGDGAPAPAADDEEGDGEETEAEEEAEQSDDEVDQAPEPNPFETLDVKPGDDLAKAIEFIITNEASREIRDADYRIYTTEHDTIEKMKVPDDMPISWVGALDDKTRHMVAPMQKDIERMMAARSQIVKVPGYRSGRLHSGSLHRLQVNDDRVFRRIQENRTKETAVSLLIDNSGSMHGNKMETAMAAGYALSQTLERVGIKHEVLGFTTGGYEDRNVFKEQEAEEQRLGKCFSRFCTLKITIYKDFNERVTPEIKKRFAAAPRYAHSAANVDGESVRIAANRLSLRNEPRKVLMVLSDGQPSGASYHPEEIYADLHRAVAQAEAAKIETIGIGIMDASVKTFYPKHAVLQNLGDLPKAVMGELKRILTQ